jgi:hypothetical protein
MYWVRLLATDLEQESKWSLAIPNFISALSGKSSFLSQLLCLLLSFRFFEDRPSFSAFFLFFL